MPILNQKPNPVNITGDLYKINFSIDDFKRIREENHLYVDKTKWIEDILTYDKGAALLFTRPRRFGKSLNISMLRYFFDMTEDTSMLFTGLYIEQSEFYRTHLNQYPVFYFNFKDIEIDTIYDLKNAMVKSVETIVQELYKKFQFKELLNIELETESGGLSNVGLKNITRVLYENTNRKVIVLIDEYDSIINQTYGTDYWTEITGTIKRMFGMLLKSNEYLEMGVLTGVSRIGKELGFSGMNNLAVYGLTRERYYEYFGFTEDEVKELLLRSQIEMNQDFYRMYNGYRFNKSPNMFNTVSMLKFLNEYYDSGDMYLSPYWINSASNDILKNNIAKQSIDLKKQLLSLFDGSTISESVFEGIDYDTLDKPEYMFTLLIDTGYLCPIRRKGGNIFELKVPNEEVLYGYRSLIDLITGMDDTVLKSLCTFLITNKIREFESKLNEILLQVSSYHDFIEKENSYHNLILGALLFLLGRFKVRSNRESGHGRYDIALIPTEEFKDEYKPIIIEFKVPKERLHEKEYMDDELLALAETALAQINEKKYYAEYADMYKEDDFVKIGISAQGKRCRVMTDNVID